jgi:hypothetical protein
MTPTFDPGIPAALAPRLLASSVPRCFLQIRRYGHRDDSRKTPGVKIVSVNCQSFLLLHEWFRRVEEKSRCGSACPKQAVIGTP